MNFGLGAVLGLMGGAPTVKAGTVIIEKLKAAKVMEPGDLGDIMKTAMQGGLGSILQNPMQLLGSLAKQKTNQAQNSVSQSRFPQTAGALSGLGAAVDAVVDAAADVVGVGKDPAGLLSTVAAAQVLDSVGKTDDAFSLGALLSPAFADSQLATVADGVVPIAMSVSAGAISDGRGAQEIAALNALLADVFVRYQAARAAADEHAVRIASVAAAASLLSAGGPEWQAVMQKALLPGPLAAIQAAIDAFLVVDDGT